MQNYMQHFKTMTRVTLQYNIGAIKIAKTYCIISYAASLMHHQTNLQIDIGGDIISNYYMFYICLQYIFCIILKNQCNILQYIELNELKSIINGYNQWPKSFWDLIYQVITSESNRFLLYKPLKFSNSRNIFMLEYMQYNVMNETHDRIYALLTSSINCVMWLQWLWFLHKLNAVYMQLLE